MKNNIRKEIVKPLRYNRHNSEVVPCLKAIMPPPTINTVPTMAVKVSKSDSNLSIVH